MSDRHSSTSSALAVAIALVPVALASAPYGAQADPHALQRMVATERAFAAATAELGVRDGFLAFFEPEAVQIEAGASGRETRLVSAVDALRARPLPPLPLGATLIWNPHTGQVSSDGSLGWLTGPFVVMDRAASAVVGQGAYFSVWKRRADGAYRVWLDEGVTLPSVWQGASEFVVAGGPSGGEGGVAGEPVESAERAVTSGGAAWRARWSRGVRVHREGVPPIAGADAAAAWADRAWATVAFSLTRTVVSGSNDLAFAVGGYDATTPDGAEHGTWVRVWQRDVAGRWRIVFETNKAAR